MGIGLGGETSLVWLCPEPLLLHCSYVALPRASSASCTMQNSHNCMLL